MTQLPSSAGEAPAGGRACAASDGIFDCAVGLRFSHDARTPSAAKPKKTALPTRRITPLLERDGRQSLNSFRRGRFHLRRRISDRKQPFLTSIKIVNRLAEQALHCCFGVSNHGEEHAS